MLRRHWDRREEAVGRMRKVFPLFFFCFFYVESENVPVGYVERGRGRRSWKADDEGSLQCKDGKLLVSGRRAGRRAGRFRFGVSLWGRCRIFGVDK